jgi:uncharacterized protein YbjT (DUF2867 family)
MPIHVILGATGGTGSSILRTLLSSSVPNLQIKILVRSKAKLLRSFPDLETSTSANINLTIFEGAISNQNVLKACVQGAEVVYVCVATNHINNKKVDVAYTAAANLVAALNDV